MPDPPRGGFMVVVSSCADHGREDEFLSWYREVHIPDVLRNRPQVRAATFTEMAGGAPGEPQRYLAVYEIPDDLDGLLAQLAERRLEQSELIRVEHFGVYSTTFEMTRDDV